MNIIDLTGEYITHLLHADDRSAYEKSYPALFEHYLRFWANKEKPYLSLTEDEVGYRKILILNELPDLEIKLESYGLDIRDLDIALFVGQDTSNGHAFKDGDKLVVWIPIESYISIPLVRVFIVHEIIHALHYRYSPEYYTDNPVEMRRVSREIATEGLASYLTVEILGVEPGVALWADYLSPVKLAGWMAECLRREKELYKFIYDNFERSDPNIHLFHLIDPDDILKYRSGYYAGMKLIERAGQESGRGVSELLYIPKGELENQIYLALESLIT